MKRIAIASVLLAACGGAGLGGGVRQDIGAQMERAQPALTACYQEALERRRKARGRIVLAFDVAAKTGAFGRVRVVRDEVGDPTLASCVVERVEALRLALARPQSTVAAVEHYPVDFTPTE